MNKLYTAKELAQMARDRGRPVTDGYIRRMCREKRIAGVYKIASSWVIPPGEAETWLQEWIGGK